VCCTMVAKGRSRSNFKSRHSSARNSAAASMGIRILGTLIKLREPASAGESYEARSEASECEVRACEGSLGLGLPGLGLERREGEKSFAGQPYATLHEWAGFQAGCGTGDWSCVRAQSDQGGLRSANLFRPRTRTSLAASCR
jgi:hypothetical protein